MVTDKYRVGGGFSSATATGAAPSGHPMRFPGGGPPGMTTDREYRNTRYSCDVRVGVYRTWHAEEMRAFREVLDRAYNGLYVINRRMEREDDDPETGARGWAVYLEWIEPWGTSQGPRTPY